MRVIEIYLLATAVINLLLAFLVFARNPKGLVNISFSAFLLNATLWPIFLFLFKTQPHVSEVYVWSKFIYLPGILVPPTFLFFSYCLINKRSPSWIRVTFYVLPVLFFSSLLFSTRLFVHGVDISSPVRSIGLGPLYLVWLLYYCLYLTWAAIEMFRGLKRVESFVRGQIKYVLFGIIFPIFGAFPFNILLPLFGEFRYIYVGPLFMTIMALEFTYVIVKHRFLDIRLVIARTVSYSLLLLIITVFYSLSIFLLGGFLFPQSLNGNQFIVSVFLAIIVAYSFQPLKLFLEKATDK